jgi:hypothetical protein
MDSYEGNPNDPLSLHKYLYASGNPVGRIDPSGNDDIIDMVASMAIDTTLINRGQTGRSLFVF